MSLEISNPYWWHTWKTSHSHLISCRCHGPRISSSSVHILIPTFFRHLQSRSTCFSSSHRSERICVNWTTKAIRHDPSTPKKILLIPLSRQNLDLHFYKKAYVLQLRQRVLHSTPPSPSAPACKSSPRVTPVLVPWIISSYLSLEFENLYILADILILTVNIERMKKK